MKKKCNVYLIALYLLLSLLIPIISPISYRKADAKVTINHSSWRTEDTTVYGKGDGIDIKDEDDKSDPGMLEGLIITLINSIGDFFGWFFGLIGLTLQNVVYGRVNGGGVNFDGVRVSLFTFELTKGNPYGITGAAIFSIMRGIIYIILACVAFGKYTVTLFIGNSSRAWTKAKEGLANMVLGFALLTLMPNLLDLMFYLRDVMIYAVGVKGMGALGISTPDLATFFSKNKDASIMSALMYTGSYFLTLYFAFQYIGIALSLVIDMFAFPFVVLNLQFNKQALSTWFKNVFSSALVPIADCCLLIIPAVFGLLGKSLAVSIIQLLVCSMLIPARGELRNVLGIATKGGLELSGLMAMRGAGAAFGAAVAGSAGAIMGKAHADHEAKEDENMANYYDELDKGESLSGTSTSGVRGAGTLGGGASGVRSATSSIGSASSLGTGGSLGTDDSMGGVDIPSGELGSAAGIDPNNSADKFANIHNFEGNAFSTMSNARRAELYRQRADFKRKQGQREMALKMGGTFAGMGAGLAMTTFMSPGTKGMVMGGLGRAAGEGAAAMARLDGERMGTNTPYIQGSSSYQEQEGSGSANVGTAPTSQNVIVPTQGSYSEVQNGIVPAQGSYSKVPDGYVEYNADMYDSVTDKQDINNVGSNYMKENNNAIKSCVNMSSNIKQNPELKNELDEHYKQVMQQNEYTNADERYQAFRSHATEKMTGDFERRIKGNKEMKSSGDQQKDKIINNMMINQYRLNLQKEDCNKLSKANLETYGYNFNK